MTTKTVAVTLVALTSQYQKSMGAATASTAKLQATSAAASTSIGSVMGPQIALAGAVVAGAAVKMALNFDQAFTRIGAITDSSQAQVAQWKEQVMGLAGETARAPQELAEALYFLASAGLDADQVMPALEASAKAAAVGLGETADIARLTANVLNAYAGSGMQAADVTDILVAAVREGTAEPDEFADALGRILPIASKAGISFDQVAASLSSLSNIGLDVNEGVTAMRGVMQTLLAPTNKAKEALATMGITSDELRASLTENGLIATLRMLDDAAGGNIDTMNAVIGNVRALTGAFGLTQQEAAKVDEIFRDVMESSGDTGKAFDETADSVNHKLAQAFVDLQRVGIELGETLIPIISDLASTVSDAIGPLLEVINRTEDFIAAHEPAEAVVGGFGDSIKNNLAPGLDLLGTLLGEDTEHAKNFNAATQQGATEASRYGGAMEGVGDAAEEAGPPVTKLGGAVKDTASELEKAEGAADKFSEALDRLTKVAFDVEEARLNWHQGLIDLREELKDGTKTLDLNSQAGIDNREALKGQLENALALGIAMREKGKSEKEATKITEDHVRQVRDEAIAAGFAKDEVDDYIRTLNLTPKQIETLIKAHTRKAKADVIRFIGDLDKIPDIKDVLIRVRSTGFGTGQRIFHQGGVVGGGSLPRYHGGGDVTSDEQLVLARKGEHILTPQQYAALRSPSSSVAVKERGPQTVRVGVRFDRRRFTTEFDHDATYSGRWS